MTSPRTSRDSEREERARVVASLPALATPSLRLGQAHRRCLKTNVLSWGFLQTLVGTTSPGAAAGRLQASVRRGEVSVEEFAQPPVSDRFHLSINQ